MSAPHVVIVGSVEDVHATTVMSAIGERANVSVVDAASFGDGRFRWNESLEVSTGIGWVRPSRGWLRRLAPPGWKQGTVVGSVSGVEAHAALQLLSAATDDESSTTWLSTYPAILRAENKLLQNRLAQRLGIASPHVCVAAHREHLPDLGNPIVMKPLGLGIFTEDGLPHAIHARSVDLAAKSLDDLGVAPYIAQSRIMAKRHLRIPTVCDQAWPCELNAEGLPLDWRAEDQAHFSWKSSPGDRTTAERAVRLAEAFHLGYSCQDWIVDEDGKAWVVDLNPAGQWLFLPEPVASQVTFAIAEWLVSEV